MRRVMVVFVGLALLLPLDGMVANARAQRYRSQNVNAFWHSRQQVDRNTYLRITWYAGVYDSGEDFWSDLYQSVERCERRPGRDRCRSGRYLYGDINGIGTGSFSVDRKLGTATLEATYRLSAYSRGGREFVGRAHLVSTFEGTGDLVRGTDSYSFHSGCTMFRYKGRWAYRQALATGTLAVAGAPAFDLGQTADAGIGAANAIEVQHEC